MKKIIQAIIKYRIFLLVLSLPMLISNNSHAQIEGLIVENWYVADASDATDTTEGRALTEGMITYRVFLDLLPGSKLIKIFGSSIHPLRFSSDSVFYNNIDRPNAYFGYQINKLWFTGNPTLALDSWITLGLTATQYMAVPKPDDADGSFIGGLFNNGGSAFIPGGLLVNNDTKAGIPVTIADGYVPNTNILGQWNDGGFKDLSGIDTTAFGSINTGNEFLSYDAYLQQNGGISGADTFTNKVLIAQLTTLGDISFEVNAIIQLPNGTQTTFVASGDSLLTGEVVSPWLVYPPVCGCTDPKYIEFNSAYACSNEDSCQTPVVFGCLDTLACNYDPTVNFHISQLCCYPGSCDDRHLMTVCPSVGNSRFGISNLYPNPVQSKLTVIYSVAGQCQSVCKIYDVIGKLVFEKAIECTSATVDFNMELGHLPEGIYYIHLSNENNIDRKMFTIVR